MEMVLVKLEYVLQKNWMHESCHHVKLAVDKIVEKYEKYYEQIGCL